MGFTFSLKMVMKRWSVEGGRLKVVLGPQNCFLLGGCRPQTPCCSWGASRPPGGGLAAPRPPRSTFERLRLSSSSFFLDQDVGTKIHDGFWKEVKAARSAALNF